MKLLSIIFIFLLVSLILISCSSEKKEPVQNPLLLKGVGPITKVDLGAIDNDMAARGGEEFKMKCSACHKLDTRYVGPPLGDVVKRRTPEFIMNMILNPDGMIAQNDTVKALLANYMTKMANQNITQEKAREILEYLRVVAEPK